MVEVTIIRLTYRVLLALASLFTYLIGYLIRIFEHGDSIIDIISGYRFFTNQSNLFVFLWLVLAIYYNSNPKMLQKLHGMIKGAVTLYITVTFVVYATILAPLHHPEGYFAFSNLMVHYLIPIAFIIDLLLFDKTPYEWNWIPIWFIYPILYIIFALTYGVSTGDFIYPFFNIQTLGFDGVAIRVVALFAFFTVLSLIYIGLSKILNKQT